jgi:hypothetical protein
LIIPLLIAKIGREGATISGLQLSCIQNDRKPSVKAVLRLG